MHKLLAAAGNMMHAEVSNIFDGTLYYCCHTTCGNTCLGLRIIT
jgi:hypothetical protein